MSQQLDTTKIPRHIAIIMDGNRRWARARGLADSQGHAAGAENLVQIVEAANKLGVKHITFYALSTENIKERSKREVAALFSIVKNLYKTHLKGMMKKGVRVAILGERQGLPTSILKLIDTLRKTYIENESITLNIALNYGGKKELLETFKNMIKAGIEVDKINDELIQKHLYTKGQPDPELVIRTGGRIRLSNFLLWQTAYSELYFTEKYWPEFSEEDLKKAIAWYQEQERNFGK